MITTLRRPFRRKARSRYPQLTTYSFTAQLPNQRCIDLITGASRTLACSPCSVAPSIRFFLLKGNRGVHRLAVYACQRCAAHTEFYGRQRFAGYVCRSPRLAVGKRVPPMGGAVLTNIAVLKLPQRLARIEPRAESDDRNLCPFSPCHVRYLEKRSGNDGSLNLWHEGENLVSPFLCMLIY